MHFQLRNREGGEGGGGSNGLYNHHIFMWTTSDRGKRVRHYGKKDEENLRKDCLFKIVKICFICIFYRQTSGGNSSLLICRNVFHFILENP